MNQTKRGEGIILKKVGTRSSGEEFEEPCLYHTRSFVSSCLTKAQNQRWEFEELCLEQESRFHEFHYKQLKPELKGSWGDQPRRGFSQIWL
jgi:hypothetical protein